MFVVVFAFEAFAKVIAYGFCVGKESYLHQRTNIFDFVVVIAAVVDLAARVELSEYVASSQNHAAAESVEQI